VNVQVKLLGESSARPSVAAFESGTHVSARLHGFLHHLADLPVIVKPPSPSSCGFDEEMCAGRASMPGHSDGRAV